MGSRVACSTPWRGLLSKSSVEFTLTIWVLMSDPPRSSWPARKSTTLLTKLASLSKQSESYLLRRKKTNFILSYLLDLTSLGISHFFSYLRKPVSAELFQTFFKPFPFLSAYLLSSLRYTAIPHRLYLNAKYYS